MTLSAGELLILAFVLLAGAGYFSGEAQEEENAAPLVSPLSEAFSTTLGLSAFAALVAAIISWCSPEIAELDTSSMSLKQINEGIDAANSILADWWILVLIAGLAILSCASLLGKQVKQITAARMGLAAKGLGWTKFVFSILAASSFVGGSVYAGNSAKIGNLTEKSQELQSAQVVLFKNAEAYLLRSAVNEALTEGIHQNESIRSISAAYSIAGRYFDPPTSDYPTLTDAAEASPAKTRSSQGVPDIPEARIEKITAESSRLENGSEGTSKLSQQMVGIILDKSAADPIQEHFLGMGNPLLDRMVSNFLDPLFIDPIKKRVGVLAGEWLSGKIDERAALASARRVGQDHGLQLTKGIQTELNLASTNTTFGHAEWDRVRVVMGEVITTGLRGKSADIQDDARSMFQRYSKARNAIKILAGNRPQSVGIEEAAFQKYLFQNPDFAAFWGYAVIGLRPERLAGHLARISIAGIEEGRVRGMREIASASPEQESDFIKKYGLPINRFSDASDRQLAKMIFDAHGEYPADGFELYFFDLDKSSLKSAKNYYNSNPVNTYVGKYCPS